MIQLQDIRDKTIELPHPPQRIVSLVPSITETLFDLGLAGRIVGVTQFCKHPAAKPDHVQVIGGTKTPNTDAIQALKPDVIIANKEENEKSDVDALEAFCPVFVTYPRTVSDAVEMIRQLGVLTNTTPTADAICAQVEAAREQARSRLTRQWRTAYLIWRRPYMTIRQNTFIHHFLAEIGCDNVFAGHDGRYPEISPDELREANPELVILPDEPFVFKERHRTEFMETLPDLAAVRAHRVILAQGDYFCWYGSRLVTAFDYACNLLSNLPPSQDKT